MEDPPRPARLLVPEPGPTGGLVPGAPEIPDAGSRCVDSRPSLATSALSFGHGLQKAAAAFDANVLRALGAAAAMYRFSGPMRPRIESQQTSPLTAIGVSDRNQN